MNKFRMQKNKLSKCGRVKEMRSKTSANLTNDHVTHVHVGQKASAEQIHVKEM